MPRKPEGARPLSTAERQARFKQRQAAQLAFARAAYRNPACAQRRCDHCGDLYRGPAVFCCIECAMAAA